MLQTNRKLRITATDALDHPFLLRLQDGALPLEPLGIEQGPVGIINGKTMVKPMDDHIMNNAHSTSPGALRERRRAQRKFGKSRKRPGPRISHETAVNCQETR